MNHCDAVRALARPKIRFSSTERSSGPARLCRYAQHNLTTHGTQKRDFNRECSETTTDQCGNNAGNPGNEKVVLHTCYLSK